MPTPGQQSLSNFYESVRFSNPRIASAMHADIQTVAIFALAQDKGPGVKAAENLRRMALEYDLPEIHRRVLHNTLTELGYS